VDYVTGKKRKKSWKGAVYPISIVMSRLEDDRAGDRRWGLRSERKNKQHLTVTIDKRELKERMK
jgi:hypothetical protein